MIPDFDKEGYWPPGIHLATVDEIGVRFGDRGVAMIENRRQLENTKIKLRELEELYASKTQQTSSDHVRALTLRSLKKRINQFKEEIARFESHANSSAANH